MTAAEMRDIDPRERAAWPNLPAVAPVGAWVCTEEGALQVQDDGTLTPRASPLPWTRPSIAAEPTAGGARWR